MALAAEKPDLFPEDPNRFPEKTARPLPVITSPSSSDPPAVDPIPQIVEVVHGLEVTINRDLPKPGPELLDLDEEPSGIAARADLTIHNLYRNARDRMTIAYRDFSYASGNAMRRMKRRAEYVKEEHPLKALAVVGVAAMALGMAARYWRSRHHA